MYEVLVTFKEKGHNGHVYEKGDTYPIAKFTADPERVSFLQSNKNDYEKAFLGKEVKEKKEEKKEGKKEDKKKSTKKKSTKK